MWKKNNLKSKVLPWSLLRSIPLTPKLTLNNTKVWREINRLLNSDQDQFLQSKSLDWNQVWKDPRPLLPKWRVPTSLEPNLWDSKLMKRSPIPELWEKGVELTSSSLEFIRELDWKWELHLEWFECFGKWGVLGEVVLKRFGRLSLVWPIAMRVNVFRNCWDKSFLISSFFETTNDWYEGQLHVMSWFLRGGLELKWLMYIKEETEGKGRVGCSFVKIWASKREKKEREKSWDGLVQSDTCCKVETACPSPKDRKVVER